MAMRAVRKMAVRYYAWDDTAPWAKELIQRMRTAKAFEANPKIEFSIVQLTEPTLSRGQITFGIFEEHLIPLSNCLYHFFSLFSVLYCSFKADE
jgi:hypothetical protein